MDNQPKSIFLSRGPFDSGLVAPRRLHCVLFEANRLMYRTEPCDRTNSGIRFMALNRHTTSSKGSERQGPIPGSSVRNHWSIQATGNKWFLFQALL
jgi:hypothetical protein